MGPKRKGGAGRAGPLHSPAEEEGGERKRGKERKREKGSVRRTVNR